MLLIEPSHKALPTVSAVRLFAIDALMGRDFSFTHFSLYLRWMTFRWCERITIRWTSGSNTWSTIGFSLEVRLSSAMDRVDGAGEADIDLEVESHSRPFEKSAQNWSDSN